MVTLLSRLLQDVCLISGAAQLQWMAANATAWQCFQMDDPKAFDEATEHILTINGLAQFSPKESEHSRSVSSIQVRDNPNPGLFVRWV